MSPQPPTVHWQAAGPARAGRGRLSRDTLVIVAVVVVILAAISWSVGFFLLGGGTASGGTDGRGEPGEGGTTGPGQTPAPAPSGVAAGTWGQSLTVTGTNESGSESVTIQVTLSRPQVTTELTLDSGRVVNPDHDRFVVIEGRIEGVDGIYAYNPLHLRLIPVDQVGQWRWQRGPHEAEIAGLQPNLSPTTISAGTGINGFLVYDVPESAVDGAAIVLRSPLQPDGPAAAYWLLD